jgi:acetyl-CoA acyltransferase
MLTEGVTDDVMEAEVLLLSVIDAVSDSDTELVAVMDGDRVVLARDEGVRRDTTLARLAGLKPAFMEDGVVTAGSSSQISDGAAAVLVASEAAVKRYGLKPRARVVSMATAGVDPTIMLSGPIPAAQKALAAAGLSIGDIDVFEVNEAFASVPLAFAKELGVDFAKTNVYGGAIANGHPLGASGAKLMTTLLNVLERTGGRYGLQTMCIGFGQATATVIDRRI